MTGSRGLLLMLFLIQAFFHGRLLKCIHGQAQSTEHSQAIDKTIPPAGQKEVEEKTRLFLKKLLATKKEVDDWLSEKDFFPFSKYDSEMGYVHRDRFFLKDGVDRSNCSYHYEESGERHLIANAEKPCRINTYGDSFTHCDQVNDGETWQEILGAHLGEPVRNFGVGGYSVYQAWLRMKREEAKQPAEYIIFNVYDDDHYRNLHGWMRTKFGKHQVHFHSTIPYVKANPETGEFVEFGNLCPSEKSLYNLCDLDWVYDHLKDNLGLKFMLAYQDAKEQATSTDDSEIKTLNMQLGIKTDDNLVKKTDADYNNTAMFASMRIIDKVEEFGAANNKKILYVLSYSVDHVAEYLKNGTRFDHEFVDYFKKMGLHYVDLMAKHKADYAQFKITPEQYVKRYYVGHYSPPGNSFCAFAIKDDLLQILDPKPISYMNSEHNAHSGALSPEVQSRQEK